MPKHWPRKRGVQGCPRSRAGAGRTSGRVRGRPAALPGDGGVAAVLAANAPKAGRC